MMDKKEAQNVFNKIDKNYVKNLVEQNKELSKKTKQLEDDYKELLKTKTEDVEKPNIWLEIKDKKLLIKFKEPMEYLLLNKVTVMGIANFITSRLHEIE